MGFWTKNTCFCAIFLAEFWEPPPPIRNWCAKLAALVVTICIWKNPDTVEIIQKIGSHLENPDSFAIIRKIGGHLENPDSFEVIRKIGSHLEKSGQF